MNYLNQGASSPNASTAKDTGMLQEHAGPLYDAPIVAEATLPKTVLPNLTKA